MTIADQWISTISHNLANASTTAYKRDSLVFNEALERKLSVSGGEQGQGGGLGSGPAPIGTFINWEMGTINPTGNPFDVAVAMEKAAFKVRTPQGELYSRNGSFALGPNSELVTSTGAQVLDDTGNLIVVPRGQLVVSQDGMVQVGDEMLGRIGLYRGDFSKMGDGLYEGANATLIDPDQARFQQGFIESSNVNAVEEMISMIKLNRAFEMAQKSAQSQDESTERLIRILQGR